MILYLLSLLDEFLMSELSVFHRMPNMKKYLFLGFWTEFKGECIMTRNFMKTWSQIII